MRPLLLTVALLACGSAQHPADEPSCATADDCAENEVCTSPEEDSYNFCGAPYEAECPPGHAADSCGNCFRTCNESTPCPAGLACNGAYCISARRCHLAQPPPP